MPDDKSKQFRLTFSSLNTQIFFFVILPISILLLAITFGSVALHQNAMRNLVGERDQRTVRSAATALREQLNHRAAAIQSIAIRAEDGKPLDEILASVNFLLADFDVGIAFYTQDGKMLSFNGDTGIWQDISNEISSQVSVISLASEDSTLFSESFLIPKRNEF